MKRRTHTALLAAAASAAFSHQLGAQEASSFCETGFLQGDQDESGALDQREVEGMRAGEFGALDLDSDGTVTRNEFAECMAQADEREVGPRDVMMTGETEPAVQVQALEDGAFTRQEYMEAAELAYDATRNEEDNAIAWARNFVLLTPEAADPEIREMTRDEFAARAAALFLRLDADGNDQLSLEEWRSDAPASGSRPAAVEAAFSAADADQSGDLSREEYLAAGAERAERARLAALARGWGAEGTAAGGVETVEGAGEAGSEADGLVTEDTTAPAAQPDTQLEGSPAFDYRFDRPGS